MLGMLRIDVGEDFPQSFLGFPDLGVRRGITVVWQPIPFLPRLIAKCSHFRQWRNWRWLLPPDITSETDLDVYFSNPFPQAALHIPDTFMFKSLQIRNLLVIHPGYLTAPGRMPGKRDDESGPAPLDSPKAEERAS